MADSNKTEQPTQKRLEKARQDGRYPLSRHLVAAAQFAVFVSLLSAYGSAWFDNVTRCAAATLRAAFHTQVSAQTVTRMGWEISQRTLLAPLEDLGRAMVMALDPGQRKSAIYEGVAPGDILTTNKNDIAPLPAAGVAASAMTADQRAALMRLVEAYTSIVADDLAADRMAKLKAAGLEKITFAWAGPVEKGAKHYYRVQGPTFLIEYDNTQNNARHPHVVWRDLRGDFGEDLLAAHLRSAHGK